MNNKELEKYLIDNGLAIPDTANPGKYIFKVTDTALAGLLGGLATEATLASLLALSATGKEFETFTVIDKGNANLVIRQVSIYNTEAHTFDPPIFYKADGSVYIPTGPLEIQDYSQILNGILLSNSQIVTLLTPVQKTPGFVRVTNAGNIPAGAKSITVANTGIKNGVLNSAVFKPGESVTFSHDGGLDTLNYDATNTEFTITTVS